MSPSSQKYCLVVNPGLSSLAHQELSEIIEIKGEISGDLVLFSADQIELLEKLMLHAQTPRRILLLLARCKNLDACTIPQNISSYVHDGQKYKIEVENVKGQENRQAISKKVYESLQKTFQMTNLTLTVDYKNPELLLIVYSTGDEFFIGIDLCGKEINARDYRVFPHSGSLKGDLAYAVVRKSGYVPGESLLIGFVKDGAVAIEAGIFTSRQIIRDCNTFPLHSLLSFAHRSTSPTTVSNLKVNAFDESLPNVLAARKNVALAHLKTAVDVQRHSIEDLDARYPENSIDRMIFTITSKDEDKINELYYQAGLLLRSGGILLFFTRDQWEVPISDRFTLVSEEKIQRGEGSSRIWIFQKK